MLITQSKWPLHSSMQAQEMNVSPTTPYGVSSSLFKRHRTLPRPQGDVRTREYSTPRTDSRDLNIYTGMSPTDSQDSSPRALKHASRRIGVPDLPPTPPTQSRQSSSGSAAPGSAVVRGNVNTSAGPSTPPNPQSPPTPDVTPPRSGMRAPPVRTRPPLSHERYVSNMSASMTESRTDSFRTAREFPESSDDEASTVRPFLPSAQPSQLDVLDGDDRTRTPEKREVGLGLGLEENETPSPRVRIVERGTDNNDFITFDGDWREGQGEISEVEREWDDNLMRNVTVRRRPNRISYIYDDTPVSREVHDDNLVSPNNATKLLRRYHLEETVAANAVLRASPGPLPSENRSPAVSETGVLPIHDLRRVSTMSNQSGSTVVTAMVVDGPMKRQPTLRHTKKHVGLRSLSSEWATPSYQPLPIASAKQLRRPDPIAAIKRNAPSIQASTTSSSSRSRREIWKSGGVPVVIIPERSSSKASREPSLRSTSSHKGRKTSLSSAPLSNSARSNDVDSAALKKMERRMSESATSSNSQRTIDYPPLVPVRSSSLSAPTSRNTSRAGSLTAESLKIHNSQQSAAAVSLFPFSPIQASNEDGSVKHHRSPRMSVDHNGDPFFGNRLSAQVTPFSQFSYDTTGTAAEVSVAKAISLYPHNNNSLLVVHHQGSSSSEATPRDDSGSSLPKLSMDESSVDQKPAEAPRTPPRRIERTEEADSPLRNPRAPPQPPIIQFIPATPNVLTPNTEANRQLGYVVAPIKPPVKRGFSFRRIAMRHHTTENILNHLSPARHLEPEPAGLVIRDDAPADKTLLHPLWQPNSFWDDEDDYSDDYQHGHGYADRDAYPPVDNRPSSKRSLSSKLKRTFAILPLSDDEYSDSSREPETARRTMRRDRVNGKLVPVRNRRSLETLHQVSPPVRRQGRGEQRQNCPPQSGLGRSGLGRSDSLKPRTPDFGRTADFGRTPDFTTQFPPGNGGRRHSLSGSIGGAWTGLTRRYSEKRNAKKVEREEQRSAEFRRQISGPREFFDGVDDVLNTPRRAPLRRGREQDEQPSSRSEQWKHLSLTRQLSQQPSGYSNGAGIMGMTTGVV